MTGTRRTDLITCFLTALGFAVLGAALYQHTARAEEPVVVEIFKYEFIPPEITVKAGTTVRWVNIEKRQYHSVWFESLGEPEPDYFFPEEFFERRFDTPGTYPYRCGPHPEMLGTVHVVP